MPSHNHRISISGSASSASAGAHYHYNGHVMDEDGRCHCYGTTTADVSKARSAYNNNWGAPRRSQGYTSTTGAHTHSFSFNVNGSSSSSGSGSSFSIQNPYYTLIYCVKCR